MKLVVYLGKPMAPSWEIECLVPGSAVEDQEAKKEVHPGEAYRP
jgi:hypothetical protein